MPTLFDGDGPVVEVMLEGPGDGPPMLMPAEDPVPLVAEIDPVFVRPPLRFDALILMPWAGPPVGLLALIAPLFVTPLTLEDPVTPMPTPEAPELRMP